MFDSALNVRKQLYKGVLQGSCFEVLCKVRRKRSAMEPFSVSIAGISCEFYENTFFTDLKYAAK